VNCCRAFTVFPIAWSMAKLVFDVRQLCCDPSASQEPQVANEDRYCAWVDDVNILKLSSV
jgi:hypothetical protein